MPELYIPKVIHYCWFSNEAIPPFLRRCIASWQKVMPGYRLRRWDSDSFDFSSVPFVNQAYEAKKWAFVADYIRLHALYTEGGIYLDSDVQVLRPFDEFLDYTFFTSHEIHPYNFTTTERAKLDDSGATLNPKTLVYGLNLQAAIMGAVKRCQFIGDCLEFYRDKHFVSPDGVPQCERFIIGPHISKVAEQFGYRYTPHVQHLCDNMIVFGPEIFVGNSAFLSKESYAVHLCNGSWKERSRYESCKFWVRNSYPRAFGLISIVERLLRGVKRFAKSLTAS